MTIEPEKLDPEIEPSAPEDSATPSEMVENSGVENAVEETGGYDYDPYPDSPDESLEEDAAPPRSPALTINIQSWATPVVGLLMLVIGLVGGFFVRPMVVPAPTPTAQPAAAQPPANAPTQPSSQQEAAQQSQSTAADREALMAALLPQVRHFKGNPDAAITIIEFSDFQ